MPQATAWAEQSGRGLTSEEEEHSISHGAQHGGETLPNDKGEEHVAGHVNGRSGGAGLKGLNLTA